MPYISGLKNKITILKVGYWVIIIRKSRVKDTIVIIINIGKMWIKAR